MAGRLMRACDSACPFGRSPGRRLYWSGCAFHHRDASTESLVGAKGQTSMANSFPHGLEPKIGLSFTNWNQCPPHAPECEWDDHRRDIIGLQQSRNL